MTTYQTFRPINRPVLSDPPWWSVDVQSLPPYCWCICCGAEVYVPNVSLCKRCRVER